MVETRGKTPSSFGFTEEVWQQLHESPDLTVPDPVKGGVLLLVFREEEGGHVAFCVRRRETLAQVGRVGIARSFEEAISAIGYRESKLILARLEEIKVHSSA